MKSNRWLQAACVLALILTVNLGYPGQVRAVTFTAKIRQDILDLDPEHCGPQKPDNCSLRSAIVWANSLAGPDTIKLVYGNYYITRFGKEEIDKIDSPKSKYATMNDFDITSPLTIIGVNAPANIIYPSGPIDHIFDISASAKNVFFENVSIHKALSSSSGAGIRAYDPEKKLNVTVKDSGVYGHTADSFFAVGGGIYFVGNTLWLEGSQIGDNTAHYGGAGIYSTANTTIVENCTMMLNDTYAGRGGAIYIDGGEAWIDNTEIAQNTVVYDDYVGDGGGVYIDNGLLNITSSAFVDNQSAHFGGGLFSLNSIVNILNSTFSANKSETGGGGIAVQGDDLDEHVTIVNSTITNNTDSVSGKFKGGAGIRSAKGHLVFKNNIIGKQGKGADCFFVKNTGNTIESAGYNLDSDKSCGFNGTGDKSGFDPKLGELALHQGSTRTHDLLPGSPAIKAIYGGYIPPTDQRGATRKDQADMGAFETGGIFKILK